MIQQFAEDYQKAELASFATRRFVHILKSFRLFFTSPNKPDREDDLFDLY